MRLILTRHGETEWNLLHKTQGRTDTVLTETGREQARAFSRRLAGVELECVYTSPLKRARETAEILAEPHGVPVVDDDALMELAFGAWEGLTFTEIGENFTKELEVWSDAPNACVIPGGEPFSELFARCGEFLRRINERHDGTIAAVSHSVPTKLIASMCLGVPPEKLHNIRIDNVSLSVIDFYEGRSVVRVLNDTSHLGYEL